MIRAPPQFLSHRGEAATRRSATRSRAHISAYDRVKQAAAVTEA